MNSFESSKFLENAIRKASNEFLLENTKNGTLLLRLSFLKSYIENRFASKFEVKREYLESILMDEESQGLFLKTERFLLDSNPEIFISLSLKHFSVESLTWVLKSISQDKMEPLHVLVMSRFKEAFGLKICQEEFIKILKLLTRSPQNLQQFNKL